MKVACKFNVNWLWLALMPILSVSTSSFAQNESPNCINAIDKSSALIQFILQDIESSYPQKGGGGITEIKQSQTDQYDVSIAQEERIDKISYQLSIDKNCNVKVLSKKQSTINF